MKAGEGLGEANKCNKCDMREERVVDTEGGLGDVSKCLSK